MSLTTTVTNGTQPIQYTWIPNVFFTPPSNAQAASPVVSPQVSLVYTVSMIDAHGCTASNTLQVIGEPFALLDKELNGEYYKLFDGKLFFKYEGQYDKTTLKYRVYNAVVSGSTAASYPPATNSPDMMNYVTVNPGDNRYTLNTGSLVSGPYVLEVINEKNERLYLRFIK